jgi:hypothetical protein
MFHVGLGLSTLLPSYFCRASKDRGCLGLKISLSGYVLPARGAAKMIAMVDVNQICAI